MFLISFASSKSSGFGAVDVGVGRAGVDWGAVEGFGVAGLLVAGW